MKNLKIWEISSSDRKQGKNMKIRKFSRESRRLGSYKRPIRNKSSFIKKKKRDLTKVHKKKLDKNTV